MGKAYFLEYDPVTTIKYGKKNGKPYKTVVLSLVG